MSFFDRLRNLFSGPPHIGDGGETEAGAPLREESATPDAGESGVERITEGEPETEEAPPDPAP